MIKGYIYIYICEMFKLLRFQLFHEEFHEEGLICRWLSDDTEPPSAVQEAGGKLMAFLIAVLLWSATS